MEFDALRNIFTWNLMTALSEASAIKKNLIATDDCKQYTLGMILCGPFAALKRPGSEPGTVRRVTVNA